MVAQTKSWTQWVSGWPIVTLLVLFSTSGASAKYCLQSEPIGVAVVIGDGQAHFHGDAEICPNGQAYCPERAYVIPGDHVLTSVSQGGYTCVDVPGNTQTTSGWIETKRLRPEALNSSPPSSAWEGNWNSEAVMRIKIGHDGSGLRATGLDEWENGDGRYHHAEFSGRLITTGNRAHLKDGECSIELKLLGTFLIVVEDDNSCGDPNTSFRGYYRRK